MKKTIIGFQIKLWNVIWFQIEAIKKLFSIFSKPDSTKIWTKKVEIVFQIKRSSLPFSVFGISVKQSWQKSEFVRASSRLYLVVGRVLDHGAEDFVVFIVGLCPEIVEAVKMI